MSSWECGVCGYIHKENEPPEKCPICEAPKKMFSELVEADKSDAPDSPVGGAAGADGGSVKKWRCTVCGYVHSGDQPPEKCPVCHAPAAMFEELVEAEEDTEEAATPATQGQPGETDVQPAAVERRWRCTVCGYVHKGGDEPPEKCPVCGAPQKMFVEVDVRGKALSEAPAEELIAIGKIAEDRDAAAVQAATEQDDEGATPEEKVVEEQTPPEKKGFFDVIAALVMKFHLHPITVHFPNGILPVVVVFLAIAIYFNLAVMEQAAYYNLIFVLVNLPIVIFTGYIEWQRRYRGIRTAIFITKIICSLIVFGSASVLVAWRLIDPAVASQGSPNQLIYFGVAGLMLAAAGIAGHLGGKLVFGTRG